MNITTIKQYPYTIGKRTLLLVKIETNEGLYGIGEATLRGKIPPVMEAVKLLEPHLIGTSVFNIEALFHKFFTHDRWRNGPVMNTAISGIEMAMWDAIGKKLGVPIYNLLGGKVRDKVPLYANGWSGLGKTDLVDNAKLMVSKGFKALKWDPLPWPPLDSPDRNVVTKEILSAAVQQVASVREAVGPDIDLLIEGHGRLDYDQSLYLVRELELYKPGFIEEPMHPDNWEGFRRLAIHSTIPIATGERLFTRWGQKRLFEENICSVTQFDLTHCGGILESKKIAAMAEAFHIKIAPHNSSGPVATMVSAQLDITTPNFYMQEFIYGNVDWDFLFSEGLHIEDGYLMLDDKPGLGLIPNLEEWEKGRYEYDKGNW